MKVRTTPHDKVQTTTTESHSVVSNLLDSNSKDFQALGTLDLLASVDSKGEDDEYIGAEINIESLNLLRDTRDFIDSADDGDENNNSSDIFNDV